MVSQTDSSVWSNIYQILHIAHLRSDFHACYLQKGWRNTTNWCRKNCGNWLNWIQKTREREQRMRGSSKDTLSERIGNSLQVCFQSGRNFFSCCKSCQVVRRGRWGDASKEVLGRVRNRAAAKILKNLLLDGRWGDLLIFLNSTDNNREWSQNSRRRVQKDPTAVATGYEALEKPHQEKILPLCLKRWKIGVSSSSFQLDRSFFRGSINAD